MVRKTITRFTTTAIAIAAALSLAVGPSAADVFHGYWIYGKIHEEYEQAGSYSFFGNATIPESNTQNGGKYQKYVKNSSIYWHSAVANGHANQIGGAIRDAWGRVGWETGYLGYPITREFPVNGGRANHMAAGSIYWSSGTGAQNVWLGIRDEWAASGWENGRFGFPVEDTRTTTCSVWAQDFQGGTVLLDQWGGIGKYHGPRDSVKGSVINYTLSPDFLFGPELTQSIADWDALGGPINVVAGPSPWLAISSPDRPDQTWAGLYTWYPYGTATLQVNYDDAQHMQVDQITAVITHELGHGLGIGHTCGGDLMSASGGIDRTPMGLTRDLYHNIWGFDD